MHFLGIDVGINSRRAQKVTATVIVSYRFCDGRTWSRSQRNRIEQQTSNL